MEKKILIVDDEKAIVDILNYNLTKEGYKTVEAYDGEQAVEMAEKEMSRAELRKKAEIAPNTMTKLSRNEYVAMPILDKICKTLGTDYGDIMEYIPEKEKQM